MSDGVMHSANKRRAKREDAVAVAGRAFRKQHDRIAAEQALGNFLRRRAGAMSPLPIDENGALMVEVEDGIMATVTVGDCRHLTE